MSQSAKNEAHKEPMDSSCGNFVNVTGRSRDSAPRGQVGDYPQALLVGKKLLCIFRAEALLCAKLRQMSSEFLRVCYIYTQKSIRAKIYELFNSNF